MDCIRTSKRPTSEVPKARTPVLIDWLKKPADHAIIDRWTVPQGTHTLALPDSQNAQSFSFLAFGDTGDSESHGPRLSPQDAVAREMARECGLSTEEEKRRHSQAATSGEAIPERPALVLHTGDLVYMTGEKRLYDRNFRRPYTDFLTPQSTVDDLCFRLPFLPVPGNHDYYDLGVWVKWLARVPLLGEGLRALTRQLLAFSMPEGGSHMGKAYMQAFVDLHSDTARGPLPYVPGERTRVPNRYYRFTHGNVDFFGLDSNTLDAPVPPPSGGIAAIRAEAARRADVLEGRARKLDAEIRRVQKKCDLLHTDRRNQLAADPGEIAALLPIARSLSSSLTQLLNSLAPSNRSGGATATSDAGGTTGKALACEDAGSECLTASRAWNSALQELESPNDAVPVENQKSKIQTALDELDESSISISSALRAVEECLGKMPESPERTLILEARDRVESAQEAWSEAVEPLPPEFCDQVRALSEEALDVQRELALERRRARYRPDDHDSAQLHWLDQALSESVLNRPGNWRVVYLHHPLYTTIGNHCERPDVVDVRENLLDILKNRAHLILSGHSHAFEWFRSDRLPNTGIVVTGGGGQVSLRPSILMPRRLSRRRASYEALRRAGISECAFAGYGPEAPDGHCGPLYHFLRIDAAPDWLRICPIGVRSLGGGAYRREVPMPVHHAYCDARPALTTIPLDSITIHRNEPPSFRPIS